MHRSLRHILTGWKQVSENATIPAVKSSEAKPRPHDLSFANWAFCLLPTFQNQKFSPNCLGWPIFRKLKCASVWRSQEDAGVNQQINLSWPHEDTKLQRLLVKELWRLDLKELSGFPETGKRSVFLPAKIYSQKITWSASRTALGVSHTRTRVKVGLVLLWHTALGYLMA